MNCLNSFIRKVFIFNFISYILCYLGFIQNVLGGKSIFWEVIVQGILSKKCKCTCILFRTVPEIVLFHCTVHRTLYRRATRHVLTRVAKCIDVDGGIFENILY
jgi:hypothetical protein